MNGFVPPYRHTAHIPNPHSTNTVPIAVPIAVLSHVVLLIRQFSSSQPPPAVDHLGVAKVRQVPVSCGYTNTGFTI